MVGLRRMSKIFTTDWLTAYLPLWYKHLEPLKRGGRCLEVGTFEGRAACHLLHAYPEINLDIIDSFSDPWQPNQEAFFDQNLAEYEGRFTKIKGDSAIELPRLAYKEGERYNFIYIDADHTYEAVKRDLEVCWDLLVFGGILFLDDYNDHLRQNPFKFGVDSAVNEFFMAGPGSETSFEVLSNIHTDYQFYVRKW